MAGVRTKEGVGARSGEPGEGRPDGLSTEAIRVTTQGEERVGEEALQMVGVLGTCGSQERALGPCPVRGGDQH